MLNGVGVGSAEPESNDTSMWASSVLSFTVTQWHFPTPSVLTHPVEGFDVRIFVSPIIIIIIIIIISSSSSSVACLRAGRSCRHEFLPGSAVSVPSGM